MGAETTDDSVPRRRIGSYAGTGAGRTIVAVCGIHGNEPAGVRAAEQVLEELHRRRPPFRGEFVAVAGNLQALAAGRRYLAKDLNRQWHADLVGSSLIAAGQDGSGAERFISGPAAAAAEGSPPEESPEDVERRELWAELRGLFSRTQGQVLLLDLHTSSASGPPFATMGDTLHNRRFVRRLPIPVVMGLEEVIDGSLLEFVNNLGHVTVGVEAGRHDEPSSVDNHAAFLWLVLLSAGCLDPAAVPEAEALRARLRAATVGIPRLVEVRYRHVITESDRFRMIGGFTNFDPVARGQRLATDARGEVRARESGVVLLPLYQGLGDDGFFLGRKVSSLRLEVSGLLRRVRAHWLTPLLPGVRRHPEQAETLIVSPRAARLYPLDLFQILGFRKLRWREGKLLLTRRRELSET
jgi:predicted deacylase